MAKKIQVARTETFATIQIRHWSPDDYYLVIPEFQIIQKVGFKIGQRVKITVEALPKLPHYD